MRTINDPQEHSGGIALHRPPAPAAEAREDRAMPAVHGDVVDRAAEELEQAGRDDLAARVRHERRRAQDPESTVLVVGEFKKGKSALINALLNARVCPVDPVAATAVPTIVRFGEQLRVRVVRDGSSAATSEPAAAATTAAVDEAVDDGDPTAAAVERTVDLAELALATDTRSDGTAVGIRSAMVELPRELLAQGLVLIDTPGVNGGLTAAHAAATLRTLAEGDAVIFVTDASQELTAPELDFFRQAMRVCPTIVVALTKIDFYPQWRRILELDQAHLREAGTRAPLLALSAPLRHHGVRTGDRDADLQSGYPALAAYLRGQVIGRKAQLGMRTAAAAARQGLEQVRSGVSAEYAALSDPARVQRLREQLELARQRADRLRDTATGWRHLLSDQFADLASDVDADLTMRLRHLRDEADARIGQIDPAATWPEFEAWLRQRANEEAIEHFVVMREKIEGVVASVADSFETQIDDLGLFANLSPGLSERDIEARDPEFHRVTRGDTAMTFVRGSAGGAVFTGMVGTATATIGSLFGIAATATVVGAPLAGAGLVLAAVFGRQTLKSTKQAQLRSNRAEATKAVRFYLEQVEMVTRKDSRDTQRRINQRLRNYLRVRSAELARTAQRNLEATARSLKADHATGKQRREQLRSDLRRIDALIDALGRLVEPPSADVAHGTSP